MIQANTGIVSRRISASLNAIVHANKALLDGAVTNIRFICFGQDLLNSSEEAMNTDPFVEYILLGDSVGDGVSRWLAFGIDTASSYNTTRAAYLTRAVESRTRMLM